LLIVLLFLFLFSFYFLLKICRTKKKIELNFSHRIDKFSFGDENELIHNPLNFEMKITKSRK
jgi:hypothetical protein